jgi:tetratricopeptide (TPR) repeat protein
MDESWFTESKKQAAKRGSDEGQTMPETEDDDSFSDCMEPAMSGADLTLAAANELESGLTGAIEDLFPRIELIGFYARRKSGNTNDNNSARLKHVLWLIQHRPDCPILGTPFTTINAASQPESFKEARGLWLLHLEIQSRNTSMLGRCSDFFLFDDTQLSEELLMRAREIEPTLPDWPKKLAHFLGLRRTPDGSRLKDALSMIREAVEKETDRHRRFYLLDDLATISFNAGDLDGAKAAARKVLSVAKNYKNDWNYGNAIYYGHSVLGRVALSEDQIESAKRHLLQAGATPGSPQLNSFGPPMDLAQELLQRGERDTVIQFLRLCQKFWKRKILNKWIERLTNGESISLHDKN